MTGKLTFSVLSESHEGNVGSDWRYSIEVKVFNRGLKGQGRIEVPKHQLPSGVTQQPPGPPEPLQIPVGERNDDIKVKIRAEVVEVDLFSNDSGIVDIDLFLDFPEPGGGPQTLEKDICVGVSESGRSSLITLIASLVLSCE